MESGDPQTRMVDKPTIHSNLGRARALLNAATDTVYAAIVKTDARIDKNILPMQGDYFRQTSSGSKQLFFAKKL